MIKIMFVCHGNICRSTMSEFVMKHLVRVAGLSDKVYVASSATSYEEIGNDTHYGTKAILDKHNIPYTKRAAVHLEKTDFDEYDYFIGMDDANIRNMKKILGTDKKIYKLLEFAGSTDSISDPWYTHNFDATYTDVLNGCRGLLEQIKKEL
ncbi:MAG: low molecular weight phosphotyrosine protein phosphatase [Clostridia bacterium]|nr:low molecular weight phosphotyrosine protein phosphatase [Clostridia bacterium]